MAFFGSLRKMTFTSYRIRVPTKRRLTVSSSAGYSHSYQIHYNNRQAQAATPLPGLQPDGCADAQVRVGVRRHGVVRLAPGFDVFTEDGITAGETFRRSSSITTATSTARHLKLNWASLNFKCRLSTLRHSHNVVKPDGRRCGRAPMRVHRVLR